MTDRAPQDLPRVEGDLLLQAEPEPFPLLPARTALIVVDMQNAYASREGYLDKAGFDLSGAQSVIDKVAQVVAAARMLGITIVWFQNGWDPEGIEAGGPGSPNHWKSNALRLMREQPELEGTLLAKGSWDYALLPQMQRAPGDILIQKPRYGGFSGTQLEMMLRARGIRDILFCGVATNVCVESTLREAFHREFWPVLVEDACWQGGPRFVHDATVFNVRSFFGWVAKTEALTSLARKG
ncbi:isochorismatase family protein [Roseomonas sp. SSH11]|uniref:Isochorismatase family protein n=1 Tax=Pararoseomonas baculiformis TaxID=2820812 RepID=A0ABS4A8I1_9PROT|nr:isochorismatase family protein [Pararoseomonas baculiformis]MBP0443300.1 isochorismatase family protein [Pararoseomonas baculiformis]